MKSPPSADDLKAAVKLEDFGQALAALRNLMASSWRDGEVRDSLATTLHHSGSASGIRATAELYRATATMGGLGRLGANELDELIGATSKEKVSFLPSLGLSEIRGLLPSPGSFHWVKEPSAFALVLGFDPTDPPALAMLNDDDPGVREFGARMVDVNGATGARTIAERLAVESDGTVAALFLKCLLPRHGRLARAALEQCPVAEQVTRDRIRRGGLSSLDWVPAAYHWPMFDAYSSEDWEMWSQEWRHHWHRFGQMHFEDIWHRWFEMFPMRGGFPPIPFGLWAIPVGGGGPRRSGLEPASFTPACYASDSIVSAVEVTTGLSLPNRTWVEHLWAPRFQYLDIFLDERSRRRVAEIVGAGEWKTLLDKEREADAIRNEIAVARAEVVRTVREKQGRDRGERGRPGRDWDFGKAPGSPESKGIDSETRAWVTLSSLLPEVLPWEVGGVAETETGKRLEQLWQRYQETLYGERGIGARGIHPGGAPRERSSADRWFRALGEQLPKDLPLHPEGLLGTYCPADGRITLYAGMILAIAERRGWNPVELSLVALVHEAAHAGIINGVDSQGVNWAAWHASGGDLHEVLAMEVMLRALGRLRNDNVRKLGEDIARQCSGPEAARPLSGLADESFRGCVAHSRISGFASAPRPDDAEPTASNLDLRGLEAVMAALTACLPHFQADLVVALLLRALATSGGPLPPGAPLELNLAKVRARLAAGPPPTSPLMLGQLLEPVIRSRPELVALVGLQVPKEVLAALSRR
ncbi:MAG: hypothetical protein HYZ53_23680 [Planctomycetes bacterium]|nr:hypothetical protein [Planctomycetota bacterium]